MAGDFRVEVDVPAVSFEVPEGTDVLNVPRPPAALPDPAAAVAPGARLSDRHGVAG